MSKKRPIRDIVNKCVTKVEEHYKLKELYHQLSQGLNVEDVLQETVEDYKEKMEKYILEVLEEVKRCQEMVESLRTEQKRDAEEE
ncbi:MAG TPA: hypothetical protein EYP32_07680, partial [Aquificaceae bacterium]|nr:hypothetical protein [Aquificaceae bacterium]